MNHRKQKLTKSFYAPALVFLLIAIPSYGEPPETRDISEMSIDELINLEVTAATKTKGMSVRRAPSVIRVSTREDIAAYGFQTLRDVLANVPGFQIQEYRAGHQAAWVRGIKSRYNNKVLWLIDGVPIRDSYYGHNGIDEILPLNMVERIEVINGPGSVLYGANAFSGVVSITTRKPNRSPETELATRASYGTHTTVQGAVELNRGNFYAYGQQDSTSGFSPELNSNGKAWEHPQDTRRTYALLKFQSEHLEGSFSLTDYHYADTYHKSGRDRFFTRQPTYGSVRYRRDAGRGGSISLLSYYEYYPLRKKKFKFSAPGRLKSVEEERLNTSLYGTEFDYSLEASKHTRVMGGSLQEDRSNDIRLVQLRPERASAPGLAVPGVHRKRMGAFVQDIWSLGDHVELTTGIRYEHLASFHDTLNHRFGLTAENGSVYGKVLYGTAVRVPSYREYLDVVSHNLQLEPEHLQTFEAQIGRAFSRGDVNLTFYNNSYNDLIKELFVDIIQTPGQLRVIDDEYSINAESSTIRGLELLATLRPRDDLKLLLGAARILSATETIGPFDSSIITSAPTITAETDSFFLADWTANALASYQLPRTEHRIGGNVIFVSDRLTPQDYQTAVPAANRRPSNADGFFKLDVFSTIRLSSKFSLNLRVMNVLDRRIYSPPFDNPGGYDVEWPGRAFRVELLFRH